MGQLWLRWPKPEEASATFKDKLECAPPRAQVTVLQHQVQAVQKSRDAQVRATSVASNW